MRPRRGLRSALGALLLALPLVAGGTAVQAADPIRIGYSDNLTGGSAPTGKQIQLALQIWRDDINAKGGILGRPVELVYYDDQSNAANVPSIYTKLIEIDKVDLLIGPYGTNFIASAIPVVMQHKMTTIGMMGLAANSEFHYPNYFSIISLGTDAKHDFSRGFYNLAMAQNPKPKTIAIVGADAEFGKTATDGARDNAKEAGLDIIYDRRYPPSTTDFTPIVRAIQALNPDLVFVAAYPPDTVGIIRAAAEVGLKPQMFGGDMIGLTATSFKVQLGPMINGLVVNQVFVLASTFNFPGVQEVLAKYQAKAPAEGLDPLGYGFAPFAYATGQVLTAAVEGTKSLDHEKLAAYMREHSFSTVVGDVKFGKDGEWEKPRMAWTQFQGVQPNNLDQFREGKHEVIVWPPEYKTGDFIYPYSAARQ